MKRLFDFFVLMTFVCMYGMSLSSCGSDDDDEQTSSGLRAVTTAELEAQPSYVHEGYSYTKYIWFKNGTMVYWKKTGKASSDDLIYYNYTLSDKKITLKRISIISSSTTYTGYITMSDSRGVLYISQGLDGTNVGNLPSDLPNSYKKSSIDLR